MGLDLQFTLDVRILKYLSLNFSTQASAYAGSGSGSILVVGTGVNLAGTLGVKGSIPIGEHVRLALNLSARYAPLYTVLLLGPIRDALEQCKLDPQNCSLPSDVLQQGDTVIWRAASWVPGRRGHSWG